MNRLLKKSISDYQTEKSKTLLVLFALILGIYGLSTVVFTYTISKRDLHDNYMNTNPASLILTIDGMNGDSLLRRHLPEYVSEIEQRELVILRGRSNSGFNRMPVYVFGVKDFSNLELNTFKIPDNIKPGRDEFFLERDGERYLDKPSLQIQLPAGEEINLNHLGNIHDPGLPPSHMDHQLFVYVNESVYNQYFRTGNTSRLLIRFAKDPYEREVIRKNTANLIQYLNDKGIHVIQYTIPPPGKHPHQGQLESLLFLQAGMGTLAVLLSILLLINAIASIMGRQIRQIGIMKAMGAGNAQIVFLYLSGIGFMALIAILIAVPLAYKTAIAYNQYIANELNFDVLNQAIPIPIILLVLLAGFTLPVATALLPIRNANNSTILDALNFEESASGKLRRRRNPGQYKYIPMWLKMAQKNAFRNKWRLLLSMTDLILGLTLLATVMNLATSLDTTFINNMNKNRYDFSITLDRSYPDTLLQHFLRDSIEVEQFELWKTGSAYFVDPQGIKYNGFRLTAFPDPSGIMEFRFTEGELPKTWHKSLLINAEFAGRYKEYGVGDSMTLEINGLMDTWHIAGIVKDIGVEAAYTGLTTLNHTTAMKTEIKIKAGEKPVSYNKTIMEIEDTLESAEIYTSQSMNQYEFLVILRDHIGVILTFLLALAVLVMVVGGIGLMSIMNISLLEKTREIGIIRAIGGGRREIKLIIRTEMLFFGIGGLLAAWLLSFPLSQIVCNFFGRLILETPLDYSNNPKVLQVLLLVMLIIVFLSSIFPVREAMKIPVRDALKQL
jgi:putative ABC transport system permease protein